MITLRFQKKVGFELPSSSYTKGKDLADEIVTQTPTGGSPRVNDIHKSSHDNEEIVTKENVDEIKGTSGADQVDDSSNSSSSDSEEDMPTLEALIYRIVKEG